MTSPVPLTVAEKVLNDFTPKVVDDSVFCDEMTLHRALREARAALDAAPSSSLTPSLHALVGQVERRLGHPERARVAFAKALESEPNNPSYINNLACALIGLGRHHEAIWLLQQSRGRLAGADVGLSVCLLCNEAEALHRIGEDENARELLEQAVRAATPSHPETLFYLAHASAIFGADEDAVEFFARFLAALTKTELGPDVVALDFIDAAPRGLSVRAAEIPELASAMLRVRARMETPIPEEFMPRTNVVLDAAAWNKLQELLGDDDRA